MNQEMGLKVTDSLFEYHKNFVDPRLTRLELPWWRRIITKKPDPYKAPQRPPTHAEMQEAYDKGQVVSREELSELDIPED